MKIKFQETAMFTCIGMLLLCGWHQAAAQTQDSNAMSAVPHQSTPLPQQDGDKSVVQGKDNLLNISYAVLVGTLGAASFYFGVYFGFISQNERDKMLKYLTNDINSVQLGWFVVFCLLGGVVAAVFQAAQANVFAPIQAFVLGATWPSVVTRIMSGSGNGQPPYGLASFGSFSASPASVPVPLGSGGAKAADVQVVIKP